MKSFSAAFVLFVAVGAFAEPQPNAAYQSNHFNCCHGTYASSIPVLNAHLQTSTVENPTVNFPSCIPPTTVADAYHCLRTLVRPQLRNEVITVPTIDRIVRTVTTPVVETMNCGGGTRLATYPTNANGRLSEGGRGSAQSIDPNAYFSGGNLGSANQNSNPLNGATTANRASATLLATPTSIFTFHTSPGGNSGGYANPFSGNSAYTNTGRINTF